MNDGSYMLEWEGSQSIKGTTFLTKFGINLELDMGYIIWISADYLIMDNADVESIAYICRHAAFID